MIINFSRHEHIIQPLYPPHRWR